MTIAIEWCVFNINLNFLNTLTYFCKSERTNNFKDARLPIHFIFEDARFQIKPCNLFAAPSDSPVAAATTIHGWLPYVPWGLLYSCSCCIWRCCLFWWGCCCLRCWDCCICCCYKCCSLQLQTLRPTAFAAYLCSKSNLVLDRRWWTLPQQALYLLLLMLTATGSSRFCWCCRTVCKPWACCYCAL